MFCPDRDWIERHLPHAGQMCLLDQVLSWDERAIEVRAVPHGGPDHPLRLDGALSAVHGIEYAAQAMGIHSALLAGAGEAPRAGLLAAVREVQCHGATLDAASAPLHVRARRLTAFGGTVMYSFAVAAGPQLLVEGRAVVVLQVPEGVMP